MNQLYQKTKDYLGFSKMNDDQFFAAFISLFSESPLVDFHGLMTEDAKTQKRTISEKNEIFKKHILFKPEHTKEMDVLLQKILQETQFQTPIQTRKAVLFLKTEMEKRLIKDGYYLIGSGGSLLIVLTLAIFNPAHIMPTLSSEFLVGLFPVLTAIGSGLAYYFKKHLARSLYFLMRSVVFAEIDKKDKANQLWAQMHLKHQKHQLNTNYRYKTSSEFLFSYLKIPGAEFKDFGDDIRSQFHQIEFGTGVCVGTNLCQLIRRDSIKNISYQITSDLSKQVLLSTRVNYLQNLLAFLKEREFGAIKQLMVENHPVFIKHLSDILTEEEKDKKNKNLLTLFQYLEQRIDEINNKTNNNKADWAEKYALNELHEKLFNLMPQHQALHLIEVSHASLTS